MPPKMDSQAAALMGIDPNEFTHPTQAQDVDYNLLDADDHVLPEQIASERALSERPLPRILAIAIPSGLILFLLLWWFVGGNSPSPKRVPIPIPSPFVTPSPTNDKEGVTDTKLALQTQADELNHHSPTPIPNAPTSSPTPYPQRSPVAPPVRSVVLPPPIRNLPAVPRRSLRQATPTLTVPPPKPMPQPVKSVAAPPIDPASAWASASQIGSFGDSASPSPNSSSDVQPNFSPLGGVGVNPRAIEQNPPEGAIGQSPASGAIATTVSDPSPTPPTPTLSSASNSILVGTTAKGELETPIAWAGSFTPNSDRHTPQQNVLLKLNQPLRAADGSVAIPSGSELVAEVDQTGSNGMVQMSANSYITNIGGTQTVNPLPLGAVLILGRNGSPLIASTPTRSHLGSNFLHVALSGLSSAASLLNQPTSQSTISDAGGFSSTIANPAPNLFGGFISGGTNALLSDVQSHSSNPLSSTQPIWKLGQGTVVEAYVNQTFSL